MENQLPTPTTVISNSSKKGIYLALAFGLLLSILVGTIAYSLGRKDGRQNSISKNTGLNNSINNKVQSSSVPTAVITTTTTANSTTTPTTQIIPSMNKDSVFDITYKIPTGWKTESGDDLYKFGELPCDQYKDFFRNSTTCKGTFKSPYLKLFSSTSTITLMGPTTGIGGSCAKEEVMQISYYNKGRTFGQSYCYQKAQDRSFTGPYTEEMPNGTGEKSIWSKYLVQFESKGKEGDPTFDQMIQVLSSIN